MTMSHQIADESIIMWGQLLSVVRNAAERIGVADKLFDEESFCCHPREEAPMVIDALKAKNALSYDETFLVRALMDNAEPGEDYGTRYEPLSDVDQETVRRVSYRFDPQLKSLQEAAQALGASEQRVLQYASDGSLEVFTSAGESRVSERSLKAFLQKQTARSSRSYTRYSSRY